MDIKEFYFKNIKESEFHYRFYRYIKNVNTNYIGYDEYEEVEDFSFNVFDPDEAITKFRNLCQPETNCNSEENRYWFYFLTYYLYKMGYEIKEFPRLLSRPPEDPYDFVYTDIRNKIIEQGDDDNGVVRYATRRIFVARLTFELKSNHICIDDSIEQKFIEISNRGAKFDSMSVDEQLSEIANLIENMLKKDGKFISLDYFSICFDFISNETITEYRKKMHCFRHATNEAITERGSYSEKQKNFFVDFGLTIIKIIHTITNS